MDTPLVALLHQRSGNIGLKQTEEFHKDAVPREDLRLAQESDRLRCEVRLLKEERDILKKPPS
jgi:hypothetical protein